MEKKARAQFKRRSTANNVEILVPVPEDADSPRFRTNIGSVLYAPEKSAIIWKIKQFGGGKEFLMRAELGLPSVKGDDERGGGMTGGFGGSMGGVGGVGAGGVAGAGKGKRPISVKFEIPYFTTSGIQVRYLKIIEPKVSEPPAKLRVPFFWFSNPNFCTLLRCPSFPMQARPRLHTCQAKYCKASASLICKDRFSWGRNAIVCFSLRDQRLSRISRSPASHMVRGGPRSAHEPIKTTSAPWWSQGALV